MRKNKILGITSFVLIIIVLTLFTENKHDFIIADYALAKVGLRAWSNGTTGIHYSAIVSTLLLLLGFIGVLRYKRYVHMNFGKFVISVLIIGAFIYQPVYDSVYGFIKSNMDGLSTIEYIRDRSQIRFTANDKNADVLYEGQIYLKNYSNETKEIYLKVIPNEIQNEALKLPLDNEITICDTTNIPTKFVIEAKSEANLPVNFSLKQNSEYYNCSGSIGTDIIIFNENEEIKFVGRK